MATSTILWTLSNTLLFIKTVSAYYCNNDRCKETEYCCGNNVCCASYTVWQLWYFWFGIVLFLVMLFMCICLWKYRYRDRRILNAYRLMSDKQEQKTNPFDFKGDNAVPISLQGKYHPIQHPPTYSEATQGGFSQGYKGPH